MLELIEKPKPALVPWLASIQVSDSGNVLTIPLHFFFFFFKLSRGILQHSLKNAVLRVTIPCDFAVLFLHGATELLLLKVPSML